MTTLIDETLKKLQENIDNKSSIIAGALGELPGCSAYVETIDKDGMWRTKYVGINYWYKGITDNAIIDKVTITKRAFREIIKLLPIKIWSIEKAFYQIYACEGGLRSVQLNFDNYCPVCREILMVGNGSNISYYLAMFLQFSPSYRLRFQDIIEKLNKEEFEKSPLTEILRLKHIFMGREIGEKAKMELLWRLVFWAVFFNKTRARKMVREIDISRAKLDEDDWYYCLRKTSYNYRGKSLEERLSEAKRLDREYGNVLLGK